jgi:hypothetical protein
MNLKLTRKSFQKKNNKSKSIDTFPTIFRFLNDSKNNLYSNIYL